MTAPPRGARRITHLVAPAHVGGLETVLRGLATAQRDRGHQVTLLALLDADGPEPPLLPDLRAAGVEVAALRFPPRGYAAQVRAVAHHDTRARPDVLHSHGYLPDAIAAVARRRGGAARVSTVHGFTGGDWKNRLYEWLQCRAYRRFEAVVAVSRRLGADLAARGVDPARLHVVPNAWAPGPAPLGREDARRALGLGESTPVAGWVGRVSREKGLDVLVASLPQLADLAFRVAVVGDGAERDAVARQAAALGVADRLLWLGRVDGAGQMMRAFDLVVLSSRTEGTPMTLLEAMAARTPVVTTAVGGVPDVVGPGEALLVPAEDPAALAAALRAALGDPGAAALRAERGAARLAAELDAERWVGMYDRIYDTVSNR